MDLVLRNALVVDGTGSAGRGADVGVAGDRIVAVTPPGELDATGAEVVDLEGLVLAPGFIDIHTHYDAQVLWDPDLTPSSWHGVTTVVTGNCGFSIAPTRPADRGVIARTLENVEGMSVEALEAGIPWNFETFPEYLDALDQIGKRLNLGAMIGHTALRTYVLGTDAVERPATEEETARMRELVAEAIAAGAVGFATSKAQTHTGDAGKPVPSRLAELEEIRALAGALGDAERGIVQITSGPGMFLQQFADLSKEIGRPVSWTALVAGGRRPVLELLNEQASMGGEVWPQVACRPIVMQVTLADPFPFAIFEPFKAILAQPRAARADLYADPAWRERARTEMSALWGPRWAKVSVQETNLHRELTGKNAPSMAELAARRGVDPLDAMVDLALEEDLATRFRVVLANDDEESIGQLLQDDRTLLGLSDAGAHASQLCDACFSTHLLEHWVRDTGTITLEQAVWRLTGQPAQAFRIPERGRIAEGYYADLVAFDADTVGVDGELERVWDFPAGADRLIARSVGIEHMWVNGSPVRRDGKDVDGARPGVLIRGGDR
jgi:N-acyl-D-aspartate/D-glutamate deacylase